MYGNITVTIDFSKYNVFGFTIDIISRFKIPQFIKLVNVALNSYTS